MLKSVNKNRLQIIDEFQGIAETLFNLSTGLFGGAA